MRIRYTPELLDEAVGRELVRREEKGESFWTREFHSVTDAIYDEPGEEQRGASFGRSNAVFFRRMGMAAPLEQVVSECWRLQKGASDLIVDRAASLTDEEADLMVEPDGTRNVRLRLRTARFDNPVELAGFLRHELRHVEDMLDPEFGYRPGGRYSSRPAEENLVRSRLRLLWNLSVAGALERENRKGAATREEWTNVFRRVYPSASEATRSAITAAIWSAARLPWEKLLELARSPEALAQFAGADVPAAGPGALCPLCSFPTFRWAEGVADLPAGILREIGEDSLEWDSSRGACQHCIDTYVMRARLSGPRPVKA